MLMLIDGAWVGASDGAVDEIRSPADHSLIDSVPRFEYYFEFFKAHTTGTTDIFIIEFRGKQYHASFVDTTKLNWSAR